MNNIELLNTDWLNLKLGEMIAKEDKYLLLITPYINLKEETKKSLKTSKAKICIIIQEIYDKNEERKKKKLEDFQKLKEYFSNVNFIETPDLHAKIYLSSNKIIVTSMNLQNYSQNKNFELGFVFDNEEDDEICKKIIEEIKLFLRKNEKDETIPDKLYYKHCANKKCNELIEKKYKYCKKCNDDYKNSQGGN